MKRLAVHFGAGALGRGLVVPLLEKSGFEVVLADVDEKLVNQIKNGGGYPLITTDSIEKEDFITVLDSIVISKDENKFKEYLNKAEVITTSVRRENLGSVAKLLTEFISKDEKKLIICAENVEKVGQYFRNKLIEFADNENKKHCIRNFVIPNTVVDRICASAWPDGLEILTESFAELGYEKGETEFIIEQIQSIDNLDSAFARKRLMVNTYADASSFYALAKGKKYLYEGIIDSKIQNDLKPYFLGFRRVLEKKYGYSSDELDNWSKIYESRLKNKGILRELSTVARNLWDKLTLEERFLLPVVELIELGEDIEPSIEVLAKMILACSGESKEAVKFKCETLWCNNDTGKKIFDVALKYL